MTSFLNGINDLINTHYPYYILLKREILENHHFPLFNPLWFGGQTLLGDPQNGIFYPFTYLYLFLNFSFATILILIIHALIALLGTYLIFRKIYHANKAVAFLCGFMFVLMPKWIYHMTAGHLSMIESLAWFPLILYFVLKTTQKNYKFSFYDVTIFSFVCTLSIFANYFFFYQMAIFIGLYYVTWFLLGIRKRDLVKIINSIKFIAVSAIFIFLLTAMQTIPGIITSVNLTRVNINQNEILPIWSWKYFLQSIFWPWVSLRTYDQEAFLYSGLLFYILAGWGILKTSFKGKRTFLILILVLFLIVLNIKTPFYGLLVRVIPGMFSLRVTSRFWFFIYYLLLIFMFQFTRLPIACSDSNGGQVESLKQRGGKIVLILVLMTIGEYVAVDAVRLLAPNRFGDLKKGKIYEFLAKKYAGKKVYTTSAFLSQYYSAKYNIQLVAGENPWQDRRYIERLKKAGGYPWFNDYAVIYPPWQAAARQAQPVAKLLCDLKGEVVLSSYELKDRNFKYAATIDKIKVYENRCKNNFKF